MKGLTTCILLFIALVHCAAVGRAQTLGHRSARFNPSGDYHPVNRPAGKSEQFIQFVLEVRRRNGKLRAWGDVRGVQSSFKFTSVAISEKHLKFSTVKIKGVRYSFDGTFLGKGDFARQSQGNGIALLEGVLRKFVNGQKVIEIRTPFLYYPGC
jgi:hypothetical protein